jgi:hypothetical protein
MRGAPIQVIEAATRLSTLVRGLFVDKTPSWRRGHHTPGGPPTTIR